MRFIDREQQIEELQKFLRLSEKKLFPVMIFGERRVGKTRLINEFLKDQQGIYIFINPDRGLDQTCRYLESIVQRSTEDNYLHFPDLEKALGYVIEKKPAKIVVLDEFQNFTKIAPEVFGILQQLIDDHENEPMMLIFMGSMSSMMESIFEDPKRPLFGRVKARIQIKPMLYRDSRKLAIELGFTKEKDLVDLYMLFGGYPKYYVAMEDYQLGGKGIIDIIDELVLHTNAPLLNEVKDVLLMEFGSARAYYYDILEAIARGHTKRSEISTYTGLSSTSLSPFLADLMQKYRYIKYELPVLAGKKGAFRLANPFFEFWFRYIHPHMDLVVTEDFSALHTIIAKDINNFFGLRFNDLILELIHQKAQYSILGRHWGAYRDAKGKVVYEIDIAGIDESNKIQLLGEVKYRNRLAGLDVIDSLLEKGELIRINEDYTRKYFIASRSGFTASALRRMKNENIMHWSLDDVEVMMR